MLCNKARSQSAATGIRCEQLNWVGRGRTSTTSSMQGCTAGGGLRAEWMHKEMLSDHAPAHDHHDVAQTKIGPLIITLSSCICLSLPWI